MQSQRIRIRLKAFDYKLIDQSALEIVDTGKRTGAVVQRSDPSAHTHPALRYSSQPARQQEPAAISLKIRTHQRLVDIIDPTDKTVDRY